VVDPELESSATPICQGPVAATIEGIEKARLLIPREKATRFLVFHAKASKENADTGGEPTLLDSINREGLR
jgi:hypothetical protein